jgi:hypothetical protein
VAQVDGRDAGEEALTALEACFRSLGSDESDIEDLLSEDLYEHWQARKAKAKAPTEPSGTEADDA